MTNNQQPAGLSDGGIKKLRTTSDIFCSQIVTYSAVRFLHILMKNLTKNLMRDR